MGQKKHAIFKGKGKGKYTCDLFKYWSWKTKTNLICFVFEEELLNPICFVLVIKRIRFALLLKQMLKKQMRVVSICKENKLGKSCAKFRSNYASQTI